jgi:PAS domain S-box-containing protein
MRPRKSLVKTLPDAPASPIANITAEAFECSQLIEGLPTPIYLCDLEGRLTYYNDAAVSLWGYSPEIGKDFWFGQGKLFTPEGKPLMPEECPIAICLREGRAVEGREIVFHRPDGVRVNVMPHPKPLFDDDGEMIGAMNTLIDVTEKSLREHALSESEKRYKLLSKSLVRKVKEGKIIIQESEDRYHKMIDEVEDYAILLLDDQGIVLNWNKGAERIKGYAEDEIIGKHIKVFYREEDRQKKLPDLLINQARVEGKATHEGWRLRKDGALFWGSVVITALHDAQNNVIGFSKVTRDLTEKKNSEDQLKKYAREIEIRNKHLEEYAYVASHDLQEPLRKIRTFSELIQENIDDKLTVQKFIDKIDLAANRMTTLIKDVLKYSHASNAELFRTTDLNKILETVLEDYELLIEQRNARIIHSHLPVVQGIPIQLHQLFSNLVSNAIKFTNSDPIIEITCERARGAQLKQFPSLNENTDYFKLTFKDNGIGFDPQYTEQIFKLFKRLNDMSLGTGVGLALCKKIAENHNGHITATSAPNRGASFLVFLPIS